MKFSLYQASRKGGRPYNEDRLAYASSNSTLLLVLADGMGGHAHGEVASQLTVDTVCRLFKDQAQPSLDDPSGFLLEAIYSAHEAVNAYAVEHDLPEPPRTTCVACVVQQGRAVWAHVGDSRLYHFQRDRFRSHTRDHSMVQQLVDRGLINEAEAQQRVERNMLYNAIGGFMLPDIEVSDPVPLHEGDLILLCSDGFWDELTAEEMLAQLQARPLREAIHLLMDTAEGRGGPRCDNLSALALRFGPEPVAG
ncbi:serine/threonine protein phosphatase PrpC [Sulfuritortus calidifontis]|uniref:Serine/threonine protein phosphatase PrpC n=1 Tax=Sulfuritortus calidifontis TaxID=1914471 RepID=A0A4R3JYZ0_9PROT|nr:protein phosphatase 2C domain-containing protein [Sulfuritortus calidifontis]TCS72694.1 serine/threonine protein phosphatase PrpC [Sulfuritortus calidifontis]